MQELINQIIELKDRFTKAWQIIGIDKKRQELIELQHKMNESGFWQNQDQAKVISQKASNLESEIIDWETIKKQIQDLYDIAKLDDQDKDVNLSKEIKKDLSQTKKHFDKLEFDLMFADKHDRENAIVAIHAGAGGTDAQDWAEMLLRMYLRFIENQGWQAKIIDISAGSEAGIKSVIFEVIGKNVYGYLKAESGVHRLVRISPFDAEKMRHTSFAMVEVLPLFEDEVEVQINPNDLRIDTYRASGHGGQGVNTTDSAVRITHLPTGLVATCQNERSQQQNKETAMRILKSKLQKYFESEQEEEKQKLRGEYTSAAWGNQVRSYVLHPYKLVKDHRTNYETTQVEKVLDGDILPFIESYIEKQISK